MSVRGMRGGISCAQLLRHGGRGIAARLIECIKRKEVSNKKVGMNEGAEIRNSWLC